MSVTPENRPSGIRRSLATTGRREAFSLSPTSKTPSHFATAAWSSAKLRSGFVLSRGTLVLAVVLAYSPVLLHVYGFTDDYLLLWGFHADTHLMTTVHLMNGRPLTLLIERLAFDRAGHVDDLMWLRLIGVIGLALFALVVCHIAEQTGRSRTASWSLAAGVVALPAWHVVAAWTVLFPTPFASALSLWAGWWLVSSPMVTRQSWVFRTSTVTVALAVSALIYQAAAMCFWLAFALVLTGPRTTALTRRALAATATAFACSSAISVAVWRLGANAVHISGTRTHFTANVAATGWRFITDDLPRALWPGSVDGRGMPIAVVAAILLVGGCLVGSRRWSTPGRYFAILLSLIPLSFTPSLASADATPSARTMMALMPVTLVLLLFAISSIFRAVSSAPGTRLIRPVAVPVAVAALGLAAVSVDLYFARPQSLEYRAAGRAVADAAARGPIRYVTQTQPDQTLAPGVSYDEFGFPTSASPSGAWALVLTLQHEQSGRWLPGHSLKVVSVDDAPPPDGTVNLRRTLQALRASRTVGQGRVSQDEPRELRQH